MPESGSRKNAVADFGVNRRDHGQSGRAKIQDPRRDRISAAAVGLRRLKRAGQESGMAGGQRRIAVLIAEKAATGDPSSDVLRQELEPDLATDIENFRRRPFSVELTKGVKQEFQSTAIRVEMADQCDPERRGGIGRHRAVACGTSLEFEVSGAGIEGARLFEERLRDAQGMRGVAHQPLQIRRAIP